MKNEWMKFLNMYNNIANLKQKNENRETSWKLNIKYLNDSWEKWFIKRYTLLKKATHSHWFKWNFTVGKDITYYFLMFNLSIMLVIYLLFLHFIGKPKKDWSLIQLSSVN